MAGTDARWSASDSVSDLSKAGIVTTGNEVYRGRIEDTFTPVIVEKLSSSMGLQVVRTYSVVMIHMDTDHRELS